MLGSIEMATPARLQPLHRRPAPPPASPDRPASSRRHAAPSTPAARNPASASGPSGSRRRRGMGHVEHEIPAAVGVVADMGRARGHARHARGSAGVRHAIRHQTVAGRPDRRHRPPPPRQRPPRAPGHPRRLIDEDARRAAGKRADIGGGPQVAPVLFGADEFHQQLAQRSDDRTRVMASAADHQLDHLVMRGVGDAPLARHARRAAARRSGRTRRRCPAGCGR